MLAELAQKKGFNESDFTMLSHWDLESTLKLWLQITTGYYLVVPNYGVNGKYNFVISNFLEDDPTTPPNAVWKFSKTIMKTELIFSSYKEAEEKGLIEILNLI